jgi:hypothetical protein
MKPNPIKAGRRTKKSLSPPAIPAGDSRLVVNISSARHKKLKVIAAKRGTTMGDLVESLIDTLP